jgi:TolA-binding protein
VTDEAALLSAQLAAADGFYTRKANGDAVTAYEKFLIMAPRSAEGRERALYRLGESQRLMGTTVAAQESYRRVTAEYPKGQFVPAASFRLGEMSEASGDSLTAAGQFAVAAKDSPDAQVRLAATYHQALCLGKAGKRAEAEALYLRITGGESDPQKTNPYLVPSLLQLASGAAASGSKEQALGYYSRIIAAKEARDSGGEALAEASLKAAVLQSELGREEEARKLFESVASSNGNDRWRELAALGALRLAARSGDDDGVIRLSEAALAGESSNKPEILLLKGDSLRRKGRYPAALETYDAILREYPASTAAAKAPFQRLLVLHATGNPGIPDEVDHYLLTASDPHDRARALLMKAEAVMKSGDYPSAAALYGSIHAEDLPPQLKPDILYKEAWCRLQGGDKEGAEAALGRFSESYPDEERAPAALAQRGMIRQDRKDFPGALADFTLLSGRYPKAPEREAALLQKALLLGQLQRNDEMVDAFALLLHDYPKSAAAPQAHYWSGWAALEKKDYAKALSELTLARDGDPKQFGERAGLRILLCDYYLDHPEEAAREASALKSGLIPPEVGRWLGGKSLESGNMSRAERFLSPLVKEGMPGVSDAELQGMLATALISQGKFKEAQQPAEACLKLSRDPASRARALLRGAEIQKAMKNFPQAFSMTEEAMLLQPEGPINAEARLLQGDIQTAKQDHLAAAKSYMTVAVLNGDGEIVRKALRRAADSYGRAGNPDEAAKALAELQKRFPDAPVSPSSKGISKP